MASSTAPRHTQPTIHTYHCLCSTLLLATPYALSSLPRRAAPALDKASILPLPPLDQAARPQQDQRDAAAEAPADALGGRDVQGLEQVLPSLLAPSMRPGRKVAVVRREDGFEKRRVWRCGRCGVGVGYEVEGGSESEGGEGRVLFLVEGGLVGTGELDGVVVP